jgi:hypothetical protein
VGNYFNYFTEIEEHYLRRRGGGLLLSTLDWALIETWKDSGIPLEAVLRGIDAAFDRYDQRPTKTRKVNSIAYCTQEVLAAAEEMKEAAVGAAPAVSRTGKSQFEAEEVSAFLRGNAEALESVKLPETVGISVQPLARNTAETLRGIALGLQQSRVLPPLEELERRLAVAEEKLFAALLAATPDEQIMAVRSEADRELAPYRHKMPSAQIGQLQKQFMHKRLLEKYGVPRLSLFYM